MKICFDMGHTKASPGASGYFSEVTEDRELGARVIEELKRRGHTVYNSTAPDNMTYPNETNYRVQYEHKYAPFDLFASLHFNSFNGNAHGTEVWYYEGTAKGKETATRICNNLCAVMGTTNRGAKPSTTQYAVIRDTYAPAVLIEVCFCDSAIDFGRYKNVSYEKLVYAICNGIDGTNTQPPVKEPPKIENPEPEKQDTETADHTHACECEALVTNAIKDFDKRLQAVENADLKEQIKKALLEMLAD